MSFQTDALRTEAPITPEILERISQNPRLIHCMLGLASEIGEFADQLKKHIFYGKPLDKVNLMEELADNQWYCAQGFDACGYEMEDGQNRVINKLKIRYPDKFSQHDATNRNLEAERKELEAGV